MHNVMPSAQECQESVWDAGLSRALDAAIIGSESAANTDERQRFERRKGRIEKNIGGGRPASCNPLLEGALKLCREGRSVFPLIPRDKRPLAAALPTLCEWPPKPEMQERIAERPGAVVDPGKGSWLPFQYERASEAQIIRWWTKYPRANVGMVTGAISGVVVPDGDKLDGVGALASLGFIPGSTPTVMTGRGLHPYYLHPGFPIKNFAGKVPGLDLRADGGYVVAPPSIHPDGRVYTWLDGAATPQPLPPALLALMTEETKCEAPKAAPVVINPAASQSAYQRACFATYFLRHVRRVEEAPDGQKRQMVRDSAIALGGYIPHGLVTAEEIEDALYGAVKDRAKDKRLARQTITNSIEYGRQHPQPLWDEPQEPTPAFDKAGFALCPEHRRRLDHHDKGFYFCKTRKQGTKTGWCDFHWTGTGYTPPVDLDSAATPAEVTTAMALDSDLSPVERKMLFFIKERSGQAGWTQPSTQEIADTIGHDRIYVAKRLRQLETRGWLRICLVPGHPSILVLRLPATNAGDENEAIISQAQPRVVLKDNTLNRIGDPLTAVANNSAPVEKTEATPCTAETFPPVDVEVCSVVEVTDGTRKHAQANSTRGTDGAADAHAGVSGGGHGGGRGTGANAYPNAGDQCSALGIGRGADGERCGAGDLPMGERAGSAARLGSTPQNQGGRVLPPTKRPPALHELVIEALDMYQIPVRGKMFKADGVTVQSKIALVLQYVEDNGGDVYTEKQIRWEYQVQQMRRDLRSLPRVTHVQKKLKSAEHHIEQKLWDDKSPAWWAWYKREIEAEITRRNKLAAEEDRQQRKRQPVRVVHEMVQTAAILDCLMTGASDAERDAEIARLLEAGDVAQALAVADVYRDTNPERYTHWELNAQIVREVMR